MTQVIVVAIYCGQFKIGLCQLSVTSEKNQNLACARNSIKAAVECGARLVVLPVSCLATHVIVAIGNSNVVGNNSLLGVFVN